MLGIEKCDKLTAIGTFKDIHKQDEALMRRTGCLGAFILVVVCFAIDVALLVIVNIILTLILRVRLTSGMQSVLGFITLGAAIYITYRLRQRELHN